MVDRRGLAEARAPTGLADRDVVDAAVAALVGREDARRREAMDCHHDRCVHEPAVGERREVVVVVDEIEFARALEAASDVEAIDTASGGDGTSVR